MMPRLVFPLLVLLLLGGAIYYLSTVPKSVALKTVTVDVAQGANAH